jgi:hypothetical protein
MMGNNLEHVEVLIQVQQQFMNVFVLRLHKELEICLESVY